MMETHHRVHHADARSMAAMDDASVELVVTSPPYPMIEMWDDLFAALDPGVGTALEAGEARRAFTLMHDVLDAVWAEVARVLVDGGIACINVGDATRTINGRFRVWPNHARVIDRLTSLGFDPLPDVLWRKPVNSGAKFMGSGMVPPNAYVTLEHEYVLVLRKGGTSRSFPPGAPRRYAAAYFWEERNRWFSDVWTDVRGTVQALDDDAVRERAGAFPVAIPYRLINMYSVYGDTVLDPFVGTGTTTLAAMLAGRDSVGYERDADLATAVDGRVRDLPRRSRETIDRRLADHRRFVDQHREAGGGFEHESDRYGFPVKTAQEVDIAFYRVDGVTPTDAGYRVTYEPVTATPAP